MTFVRQTGRKVFPPKTLIPCLQLDIYEFALLKTTKPIPGNQHI